VIPAEETRIIIEAELGGAQAWAGRHCISLIWLRDALELRLILIHPVKQTEFYLRGRFDNYRAVAPEWTFTDAEWKEVGRMCDAHKPTQTQFGASIFIQHDNRAVICVPFNRLAYSQNSGPHRDWGEASKWMEAAPNSAQAATVGDMLQVIRRDFLTTEGRMGNA
jgi:hypothetical protein